jgi:hypothetical protein
MALLLLILAFFVLVPVLCQIHTRRIHADYEEWKRLRK